MDQRTKDCVRRMEMGDIACLPVVAYQRACQAFDQYSDRTFLSRLHDYRVMKVRKGMDPVTGQRWIRR